MEDEEALNSLVIFGIMIIIDIFCLRFLGILILVLLLFVYSKISSLKHNLI